MNNHFPLHEFATGAALSAADASMIRMMLSGESIIDWPYLQFTADEEIDRFLEVLEFDLSADEDRTHVAMLYGESLSYLCDTLDYAIPSELKHVTDVRNLFHMASHKEGGHKKNRAYACMILKVMHILHHLLARELLFNATFSEAEVAEALTRKVFHSIDKMRAAGIRVVEYAGGRKTRGSLMTKLLAKRDTIAAQIFDRARFRIVVKSEEDLVPALVYMGRHLFPFNYLIPGQAENNLVDLAAIAQRPALAQHARKTLLGALNKLKSGGNSFSSPDYRCTNFVADVPLKISGIERHTSVTLDPALGNILFVMAEFQILDEATAQTNQSGDKNHAQYKKRQEEKVRERLQPKEES